ncbi:MAG: lactonase family protein, partial [Chitinophagaceae bacterium]
QEASHAHMIMLNELNNRAYVANLGNDSVHMFHFKATETENPLTYLPAVSFKVADGSGPRHVALHRQLPIVYVLNELTGTIDVWEEVANKFQLKQSLPTGRVMAKDKGSAHLLLTDDNQYLYSSDRNGYNTISVFKVDGKNGQLTLLQTISTNGQTPRHFTIDATGKWLVVGNQNSKSIQLFKRNIQTGLLSITNYVVGIPNPACLLPLKW